MCVEIKTIFPYLSLLLWLRNSDTLIAVSIPGATSWLINTIFHYKELGLLREFQDWDEESTR